MEKRRFTKEQEQENRSRAQLQDRISEMGWTFAEPGTDLGEDMIINVYFKGIATGVSFYLQLKSISNKTKRQSKSHIKYRFKIKDLLHWESFAIPVLLMVWNVDVRKGWWVFADNAVRNLDANRPNWRKNISSTTVELPISNNSDDEGFKKIKESIGRSVFPLIAQQKDIQFILKSDSKEEQLKFFRANRKTITI